VAGLLALGALTAVLITLLDDVMPTPLAALIVTALWAVVALVLASAGRKSLQRAPRPRTPDRRDREGGHPVGEDPTGSAPR
jgi:membrane protein implicated in regulation of membrane protease activity